MPIKIFLTYDLSKNISIFGIYLRKTCCAIKCTLNEQDSLIKIPVNAFAPLYGDDKMGVVFGKNINIQCYCCEL